MWPALQESARLRAKDANDRLAIEVLMWDIFVQQPGQEHWHCPCGLAAVHPYARF
jgi:hypothetical protein